MMAITSKDKVKTFTIFLAWISKGLYLEALGPAMIDLKLIYSTNFESVTRAVAGRGVGGFVGAIIGALIVDKLESHLDLYMAVFTTIAGLCVMVVVNVPSIDYVWLLYCMIGCASCIVNMAGTRQTLVIWKDKSSAILQLLHMGFGVGALLGPLLCTPYLAVVTTDTNENHETHYTIIQESRAQTAFFIIGISTISIALPFYWFHVTKARSKMDDSGIVNERAQSLLTQAEKAKTWLDIINPASYANGNFSLGLSVLLLLSVYFFHLIGCEKSYVSFVRTISVDTFKLDKDEASYLNSAFWMSLTVGRFVGSIVAQLVHVRTLILAQVLIHLVSVTAIYNFALTSSQMLWRLTVLEGFLVAPLYPLGVAYGNSQINLTGFCLMTVAFMGSFGDMVYLWLAGWLYDVYGAQAVFVAVSIGAWALLVCLVVFRFVRFLSG